MVDMIRGTDVNHAICSRCKYKLLTILIVQDDEQFHYCFSCLKYEYERSQDLLKMARNKATELANRTLEAEKQLEAAVKIIGKYCRVNVGEK